MASGGPSRFGEGMSSRSRPTASTAAASERPGSPAPPSASASINNVTLQLGDAIKTSLMATAENDGGVLPKDQRTAETHKTPNTASNPILGNSAQNPKKLKFLSMISKPMEHHGPLVESAGERYREGELTAEAAVDVALDALGNLCSVIKHASYSSTPRAARPRQQW